MTYINFNTSRRRPRSYGGDFITYVYIVRVGVSLFGSIMVIGDNSRGRQNMEHFYIKQSKGEMSLFYSARNIFKLCIIMNLCVLKRHEGVGKVIGRRLSYDWRVTYLLIFRCFEWEIYKVRSKSILCRFTY